jgi:MFS family permease
LIGDLGSGYATKKSKNMKILTVGYCICVITCLLIFVGCLHSYNLAITFFGAFLLGIFITSFHAITSMYLIKISRPVSEIYSFGFGQMLGSVQILLNGLIFAKIYSGSQSVWVPFTFSYMTLTYFIALICFSCINFNPKEEEKKSEGEKEIVKENDLKENNKKEVEMT